MSNNIKGFCNTYHDDTQAVYVENIPVFSPKSAVAKYHNAVYIIASDYVDEILEYVRNSDFSFIETYVSDRYTNEEAYAIKTMAEAMGAKIFCMNNRKSGIAPVIGHDASPNTIDELLSTEVILVAGFNTVDNPVIQLKLRQAAQVGAKVILVNPAEYPQHMDFLAKEVYTDNNLGFLKSVARAVADSGRGKNINYVKVVAE